MPLLLGDILFGLPMRCRGFCGHCNDSAQRNVSIILRQSDERINEESPARHLGFWAC
jgi:hypothetical protein